MKYDEKISSKITLTIIISAIVVLIFGAMAIGIPNAGPLMILLILSVLIFAIYRINRLIEQDEVEKAMEKIRLEEEERARLAAAAAAKAAEMSSGNEVDVDDTVPESLKKYTTAIKTHARINELDAKKQTYGNFSSIKAVGESLCAYASMRGITLSADVVKELIIAMATTRCIFVRNSASNTEDILSVVEEFFSGLERACGEFEMELKYSRDLMSYYQDNQVIETQFFQKIYAASFFSNSMAVCSMKNIDNCDFQTVFSDFIHFFKKPAGKSEFYLANVRQEFTNIDNRKIQLSNNLWCFFLVNDNFVMPEGSELWSTTLDLYGDGCKIGGAMKNDVPVSFAQFNELIDATFEDNFISLDIWKKIDKLEEYLHTSIGFRLGNLMERQMEYLTTIHVSYGATAVQAMDIAIAKKIIPSLKGYTREQINQESGTLRELLDGLFGLDNIPNTLQAMAGLQLD